VIARKTNPPKAKPNRKIPPERERFERALEFMLREYELSPAVLAEARRLARTLE
jgi:hypothetical protein